MKIKNRLILLSFLVILFNCSNDDDNNNDDNPDGINYQENIIGKWVVEYQWYGAPKENYEDYIGLPETDPDHTTEYPEISDPDATSFLFRTDGTVFIGEWGEYYTKEYYIDGNKLFFSGFEPEDLWKYQLVYHMTTDYYIARKTCSNNNCEDDVVFVRYYRRVQ